MKEALRQRYTVDFAGLVDQVFQPQVGPEMLSIWGGQCPESDVLTLAQQWSTLADLPYRLWETSSAISFEQDSWPEEAGWLERGRLFGSGGDLSLRRDGNHFWWHFVGQPNLTAPAVGQPQNFWEDGEPEGEPETRYYQNEETALLWGERRAGFDLWFDDRAAKADLDYPFDAVGRSQIRYRTYSRAGRVEFVWLLAVEAYNA